MAEEKKEKRRLLDRLKSHLRLVIMNDDTLEENLSLRLKPLNVFVTVGITILLLIFITTFIIAFTPLREYIPGYADVKIQRRVYNLTLKADSMEHALNSRELYIQNIRNIINGEPIDSIPDKKGLANVHYDTIQKLNKSREDSLLRNEIESQDKFSIGIGAKAATASGITSFLFFTPVRGTVTTRFDLPSKHYGIDIAGDANAAIKATLDGTIVFANFTSETGYVIGIQHANNLISVYKHCSFLLLKAGEYVKAGDAIAIIGNSGETSHGPHLHFELWFNGSPVDPQKFMAF